MKPLLQLAGLVTSCLLLSGCLVVEAARDIPGDDLNALTRPGTDRAVVEKALHAPVRKWQPNDEISYGLYRCQDTKRGNLGFAAVGAVMDVGTAGAWELAFKKGKDEDARTHATKMSGPAPIHLVWIGFDRQGRVCGHYREFDILPELPPRGTAPPDGSP